MFRVKKKGRPAVIEDDDKVEMQMLMVRAKLFN